MEKETSKKVKPVLLGSGLGLLATVIAHLLAWLLAGVVILLISMAIGGSLHHLVEPELVEASWTASLFLAILFWPITLFLLLIGAVVAAEVFLELALPAVALMLLLGVAVGGLAGYFYQWPLWQQRPYLLGSTLGLLLNTLALIILSLWTTWLMLIFLPGYLCLGPLVGLLTLYFIRRVFATPGDETTLKEKYVPAAEEL